MKKYITYIITTLIILLFGVQLVFFNKEQKTYSKDLFYMDTYINVKIYSKDKTKAEKALGEVENIYKMYHELSDRYNGYPNNVYEINHLKDNETIEMSSKLTDLLNYAVSWHDKSEGRLNINLGNVLDIWKKYRDEGVGVPTKKELEKVNTSDIKNIQINGNTISGKNINIDLGAVSKGYATEEAGKYLKQIGINNFLINAGGNVLVGDHYNNELYKIGIENPNKDGGLIQIIKGKNIAVSTSGGYERNYVYDAVTYHHIIDPETLFPGNYVKSVTVITPSAKDSDTFSTTLFLMTVEEGKEFLKNYPEVEAVWCTNDDQVIKSEGFSKYE